VTASNALAAFVQAVLVRLGDMLMAISAWPA
jgi:hypothetical protein